MCRRGCQEWIYEADAQASFRRFQVDEKNLLEGNERKFQYRRYTIKDGINIYLTRQMQRFVSGELSAVQMAKVRREMEVYLLLSVSKTTALSAFRSNAPDDMGPSRLFAAIRAKAMARGLDAAHRHITIVRAMLNYAAAKRLVQPVDFGDDFDPPTKNRIDRARNERDQVQGERSWSVEELRTLLDHAKAAGGDRRSKRKNLIKKNPHIYAQVLLALFAAMGSDDLSVLTPAAFRRDVGTIKYFRAKNGKPCVAAIPKVVWDAIDASMAARRPAKDPAAERLVFRTENGTQCNIAKQTNDDAGVLLKVGRNDTIGKNFQRFLKRTWLYKPRTGFKSLRAMCRTMMTGEGVDEDIRAVIMGRKLRYAVDEYYVRGDLREKLVKASEVIHRQLFPVVKQTRSRRPK